MGISAEQRSQLTEKQFARLGDLESALDNVIYDLTDRLGWEEVLPLDVHLLLTPVRTPGGTTIADIDRYLRDYDLHLEASPWEEVPREYEMEAEEIEFLEQRRAIAKRARSAMAALAPRLNVPEVTTYRQLLRFTIEAGLVIPVFGGLMLNPSPPTLWEVRARPSRISGRVRLVPLE